MGSPSIDALQRSLESGEPPQIAKWQPPLKVDFGAGGKRRDDFLSVDLVPPADIVHDLRKRWPFEDSTVEMAILSHIIEHLPDRIFTMNELHRVLIPGGQAIITVPSATQGAGYVQDPTHCSPWCKNSFGYFQDGHRNREGLGPAYGIKARFKVGDFEESSYVHDFEEVVLLKLTLQAVK